MEQKNNKQPEKQTAQKSVFKPIVEGKSVVQAGSFATQEQAENQRAKLSMLGVSTHIELLSEMAKLIIACGLLRLTPNKPTL